jgi:hypothetical protein
MHVHLAAVCEGQQKPQAAGAGLFAEAKLLWW